MPTVRVIIHSARELNADGGGFESIHSWRTEGARWPAVVAAAAALTRRGLARSRRRRCSSGRWRRGALKGSGPAARLPLHMGPMALMCNRRPWQWHGSGMGIMARPWRDHLPAAGLAGHDASA